MPIAARPASVSRQSAEGELPAAVRLSLSRTASGSGVGDISAGGAETGAEGDAGREAEAPAKGAGQEEEDNEEGGDYGASGRASSEGTSQAEARPT